MSEYHIPVLLHKSIESLNIRDNGIYVDATLGGGGHTKEILKTNPTIKLFSFDQDSDSIHETKSLTDEFPNRLIIIKDNFNNLRTQLALQQVKKIDGILFDLGVSSHQFKVFKITIYNSIYNFWFTFFIYAGRTRYQQYLITSKIEA